MNHPGPSNCWHPVTGGDFIQPWVVVTTSGWSGREPKPVGGGGESGYQQWLKKWGMQVTTNSNALIRKTRTAAPSWKGSSIT